MKLNKKMIIISLCCGVVFSSIQGISFGSNVREDNELSVNFNNISVGQLPVTKQEEKAIEIHDADPDIPEVLFSGESAKLGGEFASQFFSLDVQDLEELILEGYELEDIFRADEVGNRIGVHPREVLIAKVNAGTWEGLDTNLLNEKVSGLIEELRTQMSADLQLLQSFDLTVDEEDLLLLAKREHPRLNIDDLAAAYQAQDKKNLDIAVNQVNEQATKSANDELQSRSTRSESKNLHEEAFQEDTTTPSDISPEYLERLKTFAEANDIPLQELVDKYVQETQRQLGVIKISEGVN